MALKKFKQPKQWKQLERHPFSAEYADLKGWLWQDYLDGVKEHNFLDRKIVLFEGKVLEGWQMQRAAVELNKRPTYRGLPRGVSAEEYVKLMNDNRRHESEELQKEHRQKRIERVKAARAEGQSLRDIAEQAGVDEKTIRNDLASTDENATADQSAPDKVRGKDDKEYPASQPEKVLCQSCQHKQKIGRELPKDCPDCKVQKKAKTSRKRKVRAKPEQVNGKSDADETRDQLKDTEGHQVPDECLEAFVNLAKFEELEAHCRAMQSTIDGLVRTKGGEQLRHCVSSHKLKDGEIYKSPHLDNLKRDIRGSKPHSVCPWCKGKGKECKKCNGNGWVSKITWDSADDGVKGRLVCS